MAGTSPEIGLRLTLAPKSGRAEALSAHPRLLSAVLASRYCSFRVYDAL